MLSGLSCFPWWRNRLTESTMDDGKMRSQFGISFSFSWWRFHFFVTEGKKKGWIEGVKEKICFLSVPLKNPLTSWNANVTTCSASSPVTRWHENIQCAKRQKKGTKVHFCKRKPFSVVFATLVTFFRWCVTPNERLELNELPGRGVKSSIFHPRLTVLFLCILVSSIKRFYASWRFLHEYASALNDQRMAAFTLKLIDKKEGKRSICCFIPATCHQSCLRWLESIKETVDSAYWKSTSWVWNLSRENIFFSPEVHNDPFRDGLSSNLFLNNLDDARKLSWLF